MLDHDRSEELVECKNRSNKEMLEDEWLDSHAKNQYGISVLLNDVFGKIARLCTEEGIETMITHWRKARAVYNSVGSTDEAKNIDTKIALFTTDTAGISIVQNYKNSYKRKLSSKGITSEETYELG
jgi:hypothetical protein